MNKFFFLLFPLIIFSQEATVIGDVDCDGEITSEDASLILQFVTNVINTLPCEENMTGLTPEQLQEIINMMNQQLNINYNSNNSNNYPTMISSESEESFNFSEAMDYCKNLEEGGYNNWYIPTIEQLYYAATGGINFPDDITNNYIWSSSILEESTYIRAVNIETGQNTYGNSGENYNCRCISNGSNGTNENINSSSETFSSIIENIESIIMIGPMYIESEFPNFEHANKLTNISYEENSANNWYGNQMYFFDAIRFCRDLEYDNYDDWYLPTEIQLKIYTKNVSDIIIPNINNLNLDGFDTYDHLTFHTFDTGINAFGASGNIRYYPQHNHMAGNDMERHCFCVR